MERERGVEEGMVDGEGEEGRWKKEKRGSRRGYGRLRGREREMVCRQTKWKKETDSMMERSGNKKWELKKEKENVDICMLHTIHYYLSLLLITANFTWITESPRNVSTSWTNWETFRMSISKAEAWEWERLPWDVSTGREERLNEMISSRRIT